MYAPTIRTARLLLRPHRMSDAEAWYRIQADPEVLRYLPWPRRNREESRAHLRRRTGDIVLSRRNDFLALAVERDGTLVGDVSMHLRVVPAHERQVEAGWVIGSEHGGKGYAIEAASALLTFAFTQVGAKTAIAVIDERNERSLRLAKRLGFIDQGWAGGRRRLVLDPQIVNRAAPQPPHTESGRP